MAYIYQIENDINGKIYVGQTSISLEERWRGHCRDRDRRFVEQRPLYMAMNKYGLEHFHMTLLEECPDELVSEREVYWIEQKDSYHNGYNATYGGEGRLEYDYDEIERLFLKGISVNEISKKLGCCSDTVYTALRIKNYDLLKINTEKLKKNQGKSCYCSDLKGNFVKSFNSLVEAGDYILELGTSKSTNRAISGNIGRACNKQRKTAYGFVWNYYNDDDVNNNERSQPKSVLQLDLDGKIIKEYSSLREASIAMTGKPNSYIKKICQGSGQTAYGYKWKFKDDINNI